MPQQCPSRREPPPPAPAAVLLPLPVPGEPSASTDTGPAEDRVWIERVLGVLVATYTRPGDWVATNRPDFHIRIAAVAGFLDRTATLLTAHPWPPAEPSMTGSVQLILGWLPEPGGVRLESITAWMQIARTRLRPGGYLIATVDPIDPAQPDTARSPRYHDYATAVVTGARAAGLVYHQHLIAIHAPLREPEHGASRPPAPATPGTAPGRQGRPTGASGRSGFRHARAHTDLFVFANHQASAASAGVSPMTPGAAEPTSGREADRG